MSRLTADALALACIIGGAAVACGATVAMMDGQEWNQGPCAVEAVAHTPQVYVASDAGVRWVVARPDVRVHSRADCGAEARKNVRIHIHSRPDQMREMEIQLQAAEEQLEFRMEELAVELEGLEVELGEDFGEEIEARVEAEMKAVQKKLKKLKEKGIR